MWAMIEGLGANMVFQIFPNHRNAAGGAHTIGPGVEMREDPIERRRRSGEELDAYTSLE